MKSDTDFPLVCICIPTYNAQATIRETLASIVGQTYPRLAILIVDNASTDRTLELVAEFDDKRIEVHLNQNNIGAEGNFNRCIALASGTYTAIYHADDVYEPDMVAAQVRALEDNPGVAAVFTEATLIDGDGKKIGALSTPAELRSVQPIRFDTLFKAILRNANFLICPSAMGRTAIYKNAIQRWRGDLFGSAADLDVWLRMAQVAPLMILARPLLRYRLSDAQFTAQVRLQVERADFFRVTDYYLAEPTVKNQLDDGDLRNIARLELRDQVMRVLNFILLEQYGAAKDLMQQVWKGPVFRLASAGKRGVAVLLGAVYLHSMLILNLGALNRPGLAFLKQRLRK